MSRFSESQLAVLFLATPQLLGPSGRSTPLPTALLQRKAGPAPSPPQLQDVLPVCRFGLSRSSFLLTPEFPVTVVKSYHKLSGLKHYTPILLEFSRSEA